MAFPRPASGIAPKSGTNDITVLAHRRKRHREVPGFPSKKGDTGKAKRVRLTRIEKPKQAFANSEFVLVADDLLPVAAGHVENVNRFFAKGGDMRRGDVEPQVA